MILFMLFAPFVLIIQFFCSAVNSFLRLCGRRGAPCEEHNVTLGFCSRCAFIQFFNIFNIVFNISTLLNFITTEYFNISTSFQQNFQHINLILFYALSFIFYGFQLFHIPYYYYYNKLYYITCACARVTFHVCACARL